MNNITKQMSISETVVERLSDKRQLIAFLKEHGIADVCAIYSIDQHTAEGQRQGLIASVEEERGMKAIRIIIDIRAGQPTTEQVFDMVYGKGKDCSKRIIVFTEEANELDHENPTADEYVVSTVIETMNLYPLNIHLLKVSKSGMISKCRTDSDTSDIAVRSIKELPSALRFRIEEFWAIYFDSNCGNPSDSHWKTFDGDIRNFFTDWGYRFYIDHSDLFLQMPIYWDEWGVRMMVNQMDDNESTLIDLWSAKQCEICSRFNNPVHFSALPGRLSKIFIDHCSCSFDRRCHWYDTHLFGSNWHERHA